MKPPVCRHGEARLGRSAVMLARGDTILVFGNTSVEVCDNFGEAFHFGQVRLVQPG